MQVKELSDILRQSSRLFQITLAQSYTYVVQVVKCSSTSAPSVSPTLPLSNSSRILSSPHLEVLLLLEEHAEANDGSVDQ